MYITVFIQLIKQKKNIPWVINILILAKHKRIYKNLLKNKLKYVFSTLECLTQRQQNCM